MKSVLRIKYIFQDGGCLELSVLCNEMPSAGRNNNQREKNCKIPTIHAINYVILNLINYCRCSRPIHKPS